MSRALMRARRRFRPLAVLFFLLCLPNLAAPEEIWLWQISVVTNEFGHWFALLGVWLTWRLWKQRSRSWALLTAFASLVFIGPVWDALSWESLWRQELQTSLQRSDPAPELLSIPRLFLGYGVESVKPLTLEYKRAGDESLTLDFFRATTGEGPRPWVVIVHGGGWDSGDSKQLPALNSLLAHEGYGVISINYRLAPKHQWPAPREDLRDAIAFIKSRAVEWNLDPGRYFILGRSAGAQIAGVVAAEGDPALKGYIGYYPPTDLTFGYDVGEEDDMLKSRGLLRDYMGGTPYEKPDAYAEASVIEQMLKSPVPTLLFHGMPDRLTWFKHSERLALRMKERGLPCAFVRFSWAPHGFDYNLSGPAGQVAISSLLYFMKENSAPK